MHNYILRASADAEFSTPDAKAGTDVIARCTAMMSAISLLKKGGGNPVARPDLAVVGMSAELEIDTGFFCLF